MNMGRIENKPMGTDSGGANVRSELGEWIWKVEI